MPQSSRSACRGPGSKASPGPHDRSRSARAAHSRTKFRRGRRAWSPPPNDARRPRHRNPRQTQLSSEARKNQACFSNSLITPVSRSTVSVSALCSDTVRDSRSPFRVHLDPVGEQPNVVEIARSLLGILRQLGLGSDVAGGAVGAAAQRDRTLGDRVVVVGESDRKRLEQRVQRREVQTLDVPVRDLDL